MGDWRDDALCLTTGSAPFFEPRPGSRPWDEAYTLCRACPVMMSCRHAALDEEADHGINFRYGVRGGLSAKDRLELRGWHDIDRHWHQWKHQQDRIVLHHDEWTTDKPCCPFSRQHDSRTVIASNETLPATVEGRPGSMTGRNAR